MKCEKNKERSLLIEWLAIWCGNEVEDWEGETSEFLELNFEKLSSEYGQ